jgi:hypothetical protein
MKKLVCVAILGCGLMAGCEDRITARDVHSNMSPELDTTSRTPGEINTQLSRTVDTNGRMFWDDLMSVMLLDKPSRLSVYPIP